MTDQETSIVNNIANKLEFILQKNEITILGLSRLLKMDKQPLYRIIKREHIPNMSFLEIIANYLNCTIIELIDDRFFFDINIHHNKINNKEKSSKYRIYIYDKNFVNLFDYNFFGIIENSCLKVFYMVNRIMLDGCYLIENSNELDEISIISAGSNLIIALIDNKEVRLNPNTIKVIAKLYKILSIADLKEYAKEC